MSLFALGLVLTSALFHATWNFLAKRVSGDVTFVWLFSMLGTLIYTPVLAVVLITQPQKIGAPQLISMAGSLALHIGYYYFLNRGYRVGDLSLVYPLARGAGPLLSTFGAIALLGERPGVLVLVGTVLIAMGVFFLTGDPRKLRGAGTHLAVFYGLLTGIIVAAYTLWDKEGVSVYMVTPIMLNWVSVAGQTIVFAPLALRRRVEVRALFRTYWREALGVAILDPLGYILFLTALSFSQVSYLAPARQVSILLGTFMGARLLSEGNASRRLAAVGAMTIGLVILAFG